ncbi:trithorax group protein osa-like isoform X2 [Liolophura sinensis]|uniref:trithorax group protein osa-like isoform X2 n=1 Tax=Liolophura sinensis TaxID=3198878 RepID=UPI0031597A2D
MPRKNKSQETSRCDGLRAMWELPYLNQTLGFLQDKLKLAHFTIQEFEDSLLEKESWPLLDIFTNLLRYLTGNTAIVFENLEDHLSELITSHQRTDNSLKDEKLSSLSPENKVQLLKWLLDQVIEGRDEDVSDYLNDHFSPNDLRPINVGQDAFNNTYWYFGDQRLYKENTSRKAGKKDWETVCVTLKDWRFFLKQFRKTTNPQEKELFHYLSDELFPLVRAQLESAKSVESSLCPAKKGEVTLPEELEFPEMLKETDGMPNETSGNSVKCEIGNVKAEMKEEAVKSVEPESGGIPPQNPNPMPNGEVDVKLKLENGTDKTLQENKKGGEDKPLVPPLDEAPPTVTLPNHQPPAPPVSQQGVHSQPPMSMDAPFMQQQNQIFVFSTGLANQAAECVMQGQYKSILAFHMDQPGTKKILQHPLKNSHLNKSAGMPLYSMANMRPPHVNMMKNEPRPRMPGANNPTSSAAQVAQWVQQQNANLQEQGMNFPPVNPGFSPTHPNMPSNMQGPGGPIGPNFPMMPGNPGFDMFMDGGHSAAQANLLQSKVPNENLTPEQLHRREEQLANLRKIQQMLFPEQRQQQMFGPGGPGVPGGPGMMQGNMPGGMFQHNMMASQPNMGSQQGMMMSPGPISPPNNMMTSQQQFMMSQNMSQFGPGPGPGPQPQNMQNMTPAQREWVRLQQEFMMDKGRRMRHQMAQQMMQQHPSQGPPPSYHSSIAHKRHGSIGMNNPTSPNTNGPLSSPQMSAQSSDPQDPLGMFVGPAQRRPSMDALDPTGAMNPGMSSPMGPFEPGMMPGPGGVNMPPMPMGQFHNGMPASRKMLGHLHRAGNPEQFQPEVMMGGPGPGPGSSNVNNSSGPKPPPSYAQAQKRKREDMEELYKNLQPTPSPQQMNYLNQFEGQELTITKQLNSAYHEQSSTSDSQNNHFPHNQSVNSPLHAHGPGSNKSPVAASHQVSNPGALGSPSISRPGPSPLSGASMRLSHYDPPPVGSPNTPTSKTAMSNITSASLANLAKGVEHLSNQMQQNMMQGGPFHSIQIQGQMSNPGQGNGHPPSSTSPTSSSMPPNSGQPSVNNTYVNATMSIQQLNIQSVNAPSNYNPSMQVQQMNNDPSAPPHVGMPIGASGVPPSSGSAGGPGMSSVVSMSQSQSSVQSLSHANATKPQFPSPPVSQIPTGPSGPMVPVSGAKMNSSPSFAPASGVGNANIQIQPKAPNTIQYLPANPPATQASMNNNGMGQPGMGNPLSQGAMSNPMSQSGMNNPLGQPGPGMVNPMPQGAMGNPVGHPMGQTGMSNSMVPNNMNPSMTSMKRPEMEFMNRFPSPMTNLEGKIPTSKMNYLPNSSQNPGMPNPRMGGAYSNQAMQAMQQQMMMRGNGPQSHHGMPNQNGMSSMGPMNSMAGGMPPMGSPMGGMGSPNAMSSMPTSNMNISGSMPQMSNGMNPMMAAAGGGPSMNNISHMNSGMGNMNNMGPMGSVPYGNNPSFSPGGQPQMMTSMMQSQQMQFQAQSMSSMPMQGPMMSRQANPSAMRMSSPPQGMMQPGGRSMGYNAQFQQFQQQIYSQGRPRQMSPIPSMMGNPVQPYMDMMPNMPGPT